MTAELAIETVRNALMTAFWLSLPLLAIGFVAGVIVSLLQTLTSMQDSAFGAVPRLAAFLLGLLLFLPWMTKYIVTYTVGLLNNLGRYAQ